MSKQKRSGNREAKKPKKPKPLMPTATSIADLAKQSAGKK